MSPRQYGPPTCQRPLPVFLQVSAAEDGRFELPEGVPPTRFPSLWGWVGRRSIASVTWPVCPLWCVPNVPGCS